MVAIFHLYTPLMSSKRKGRPSAASQSSNQSPEEKRSKNSETDEVFEALEMAEDVGLKLQRVLDKVGKLDKIEAHLSEVSASLASIEEKVSRLDEGEGVNNVRPCGGCLSFTQTIHIEGK